MELYLLIWLMVIFPSLYLASPITDENFFYRSKSINGTSIICLSCPPGTYLEEDCIAPKTTGRCRVCPLGYFQPTNTYSLTCLKCATECLHKDAGENSTYSSQSQAICESTQNYCLCQNGSCILDSNCPPGKEPVIEATSSEHTVCQECPEETFSEVYSRTEMCKPFKKCGTHEVAILNSDKSHDRVCIPRYGDHVNITDNMTTMSQSPYVTDTNRKVLRQSVEIFIIAGIIFIAFILISIVLIIKMYFKSKKKYSFNDVKIELQNENALCDDDSQEHQEQSIESEVISVNEKTMQCNYNRRRKKDDQTLPNMQQVYTEQLIADDSIVFKGHNHPNDLNKLQGAHQEEYELPFGHMDAVQCSCNGSKMYDQRLPNIGQEEAHSELFRDVYNTGGRLRKSLTLSLHELEPLSTQSKNNGTITTSLPMNTPSTEETIPLPHLHKQKTILSTDWQTCELIDNQGCILQLRNSDVITTFPPGVLSGVSSDYCYKTVHNNIERLAAVLGLPVDTIITSPAPEYHMQTSFADFVEVKVPHRMPKNFKEIKVHSFSKHCNGDKVDLVEVPRYETKQEAGDKMDMFFVINSSSVLIYTKHFSGFVCTTCQGFIEYNLSASIYGRKGVIDNCTDTLDVMLYLKGAKSTIADFEVTMEDKIDKRFHHLETERVKLLERHQQRKGGQLQFRFGLLSNSVHNWIHRKYNNNDQFQHSLLLVDPETLMRDCEKHIIHSPNTKWYLQRNGETNENCDFYIEVVHKEKQPSALDEMSFVKTSIPASENFAVASGLPQRENTATIPGAITDIALTLKENLNQEECLKLIKHLGCLQYIPPVSDSRQRNDFRYDYWYSAFIQCYNRLQDNFITRVLDGLTKMDKTRLVTLVRVHSPSNNTRVASVSPIHRPPAVQDDDRHLIAQPSSAEGDKSD